MSAWHAMRSLSSREAERAPHGADTPLDSLWRLPAILRVLAVAQAIAFVLSLAPGIARDWWVYFLLASLAVDWIALLTLGALYLLRH